MAASDRLGHAVISRRHARARAHPGRAAVIVAHSYRGPLDVHLGRYCDRPADVRPKAAPMTALAQVLPSPGRAVRMVQRNLLVYKHTWMVIFSGFFEPLFYLLGIGFGVGAMVPSIGGISYIAF